LLFQNKTERIFYMNARQFGWLVSVVLSSSFLTPIFGASPDSNRSNVETTWVGVFGNSPLTQRDIFDAFHSMAPAHQPPAMPEPLIVTASLPVYPNVFRTIDGRLNHAGNLGMAGKVDLRNTTVGYCDGIGQPAGCDRLGARDISNDVCAQGTSSFLNSQPISGFVWAWGTIVDHDMVLTRNANPQENFNILVPTCDPVFDPRCRGGQIIFFNRSAHDDSSGIREQINANTTFIDASFIYGSDLFRSIALRTLSGGQLLTSTNNLLPFNLQHLDNQPTTSSSFFVAGDVRSNENLALCALQTLFMREHNFWAAEIAAGDPTLSDQDVYMRARAIVGAEIELITYRDFIPILLGPNAIPAYTGFNRAVDPRVSLAFATAANRVAHSMVPPLLERLDQNLHDIGDVNLQDSLFQPQKISASGIEVFLRGLANQIPQEVDGYIVDGVRNFAAGGTPAGFDLIALDIQRGRDHGLPGYNQVRTDFGLTPKATFADVTSDPVFQARLALAYTSPDDMDVMVGGMVEDHINGSLVGETFWTILQDQFVRSRDGDSFWYESYLDPVTLALVQQQTLSIIIKRNCPTITTELQNDVFHVP